MSEGVFGTTFGFDDKPSSYHEVKLDFADAYPATADEIEDTRMFLEGSLGSVPGSNIDPGLAQQVLQNPDALATFSSLRHHGAQITQMLAHEGYVPPTSDPYDF